MSGHLRVVRSLVSSLNHMSIDNSGANDSIEGLIGSGNLTVGNVIKAANLSPTTASVPLFSDANSKLNAAGFPFALQLLAGVTNTINSVVAIEGSSTGTANDLMHLTLVQGLNVTTFTSQAFFRVTLTDDAGNITNGQYYIQLGTLS